jgi:pilus assembly protein Flp/PilA
MRLSFAAASARKSPHKPLTGVCVQRLVSKFLRDETAATAIEYCLIASFIALAIVVTVQGIGPQLSDKFTSVNNSLK